MNLDASPSANTLTIVSMSRAPQAMLSINSYTIAALRVMPTGNLVKGFP